MSLLPRRIPATLPPLTLALMLAAAAGAFAQQAPPAPSVTAGTTAAVESPAAADAVSGPAAEPRSSHQLRSDFGNLLRESPPELATILVLDPTLLSNQAYLEGYPELAHFVAAHPEVRRNPRFYLAEFTPSRGSLDDVLEPMLIFSTFLVIAFAIAWLLRTLIEQRRWSRLSRTQSEVHNKILERVGTSEALLDYMRTPAGSKFLESAPIPLHTEPPGPAAPIARAMWSIQLGVVVAAGALGMLLVSGRLEPDDAEAFFAMGVIALCVGGGFVVSAVVSLVMSRRLGLWPGPVEPRGEDLDDARGAR